MTVLNLHLVSDSTGETLNHIARACTAQFEETEIIQHTWSLIRSDRQMRLVCEAIGQAPGIVIYTLMQDELRDVLTAHCAASNITAIPVLEPVLAALSAKLGRAFLHQPGRQHALDRNYFRRIEAMEYALSCDDGQGLDRLQKAEVILVGVSRSSKTPTCMYLANRGIFAANVPLIAGASLPPGLLEARQALIVGLTRDVEGLVDIRRNRMKAMNENHETSYIDPESVAREVLAAKRLCAAQGWPVIDVSRRSIEETAAEILSWLARRQGKPAGGPENTGS